MIFIVSVEQRTKACDSSCANEIDNVNIRIRLLYLYVTFNHEFKCSPY